MKYALIVCAICAGIAAFGLVKDDSLSGGQPPRASKEDGKDILRMLQDARVIAFNGWAVQNSERKGLTYAVQAFDQDQNHDGAGVKLSIFDQAGTIIYEDYFSQVQSIYQSYALRRSSPQLIVEASEGGSTSFLKMLDYQNGKIVDLMRMVEPNNGFTVDAEVRPQLRTGVNPAAEPYEILLTEGVGLASPVEKDTKVFRYKDGAYRYVATFPTREVDNYIERLIARSAAPGK